MAPKKARNLAHDACFARVVGQQSEGHKTVGKMVYNVLRAAILAGAFAPGEWLRQESLADAIGVSRIPVRTALLQLESEGLVDFHAHRGARLRILGAQQIDEIYRLRMLLEMHALQRSMSAMTRPRLATLREVGHQLDENPEPGEFLDLRLRFFRELYDATSNPLLVKMIEELRSHVARYLLMLSGEELHFADHVDLVACLAITDVEGAESWLRTYLDRARENVLRLAAADQAPKTASHSRRPSRPGLVNAGGPQ